MAAVKRDGERSSTATAQEDVALVGPQGSGRKQLPRLIVNVRPQRPEEEQRMVAAIHLLLAAIIRENMDRRRMENRND